MPLTTVLGESAVRHVRGFFCIIDLMVKRIVPCGSCSSASDWNCPVAIITHGPRLWIDESTKERGGFSLPHPQPVEKYRPL